MTVWPLNREVAIAVLTIGKFTPVDNNPNRWVRQITEEGAQVTAHFGDNSLELEISPAISTAIHHSMKRRAAGVYFEIAAKYAEKVGGEIAQKATVEGCKPADGSQLLMLARYPSVPLTFDRVCAGFQIAINGELMK